MCGIAGLINLTLSATEIWPILQRMTNMMIHRGPDDEGFFVSHGVGLGMRRLSIIDLAGGNQPIYNEDKSVVVVFNGEIYNYRDLREQLRQRGHTLRTASDTEVIVHLYEDFGEDCVHKLRGMFAFAVWDARRQRLFLARDRLGIKPLYYTQIGERLVFGSEIKAVLQHPGVEARPDQEGLSNFLSLRFVPAPQTMFAGIYALPPGHTLTCDPDGVKFQSYWDLSFASNRNVQESEDAYAEQLGELLRESVRIRLMSDVPFGSFLSGGIDSSTIVALMSEFLDEPVKTFSVGFEGDGEALSELPYARLIAKKYQTDHHEIIVRPQDLIALFEKVVWHLDQPIADDAALANYMLAELASRHVKMVLSGEGGDELFAGYARYAFERLSPLFQKIPELAKSLALSMTARVPGLRRPKIALYALCQSSEATRLANWFPLFNSDMKSALLSDDLKAELNGTSTDHVFSQHLTRTDAADPLNRMLYVDTKLWLADDLLARGDKMSMAAFVEARVPFLDHNLVEFAASLPPHLKVKRLTRKYLLKRICRAWLPDQIIYRKKQGFPIPISVWFRKEARSFVRDILSPTAVQKRGLFKPEYVNKLLDEHEGGFADHGLLVWGLLNVELWYRLFIDSQTRAESAASSVSTTEAVRFNREGTKAS